MKVLVAENQNSLREKLSGLLNRIDENISITDVSKYREAFNALDCRFFDLIILDIDLPDRNWEDGLNRLREKSDGSRIVVISSNEDSRDMRKAVYAGAIGYIPKSVSPEVMAGAIKIIIDGGTYMPIQAVVGPLEGNSGDALPVTPGRGAALAKKMLTTRQMEVMRRIGEGKSNKQIAFEMEVSEATVKLHINTLLRVFNAKNRTQALITAQKLGIL